MARAPTPWPLDARPIPDGPLVALVPGEAAPLLPVALPAALSGPGREQVARRQLADRLGAAAATLDLRPARLGSGRDGWGAMLAAERAALAGWRAALAPAGRRVRALLPDYLALPAAPGLWVLAIRDGRVRARLGPADGFAAETALAAAMLAEARARGPQPRGIVELEGVPEGPLAAALAGLPRSAPSPELRAFALGELALDLRADADAATQRLARRLGGLVWPGALALAGGLAWAAAVWIETERLRDRARAIEAETVAVAQARLLPPGPVVDLPLQVARALDSRRAEAAEPGALALLAAAARGLAAAGAVPSRLVFEGGAVRVDLSTPGFAALEAVAQALADQGLEVQRGRQTAAGGGAVAASLELRLRP